MTKMFSTFCLGNFLCISAFSLNIINCYFNKNIVYFVKFYLRMFKLCKIFLSATKILYIQIPLDNYKHFF